MKKAQTTSHLFVLCPNCGKSEHRVDHLEIGIAAGPWFCYEDDCGVGFTIKRTSESDFQVAVMDNETMKSVFILLQYRDDPALQIIVSGIESQRKEGPEWLLASQSDPDGHHEYFYNEHTCPTNYLLGVEVVNYKGDTDPHGVFEFVRVLTHEERQAILDSRKTPWELSEEGRKRLEG